MRTSLLLLLLAVLLFIGNIRAEDEDEYKFEDNDDDDDDDHDDHDDRDDDDFDDDEDVISHLSPAVHHFGSPVLPLDIKTTTTRPTITGRAPSISPTRIVLSTTIRTVTRYSETTSTDAVTTPITPTSSRPERRPSITAAATPSRGENECGVPFDGPYRLIVDGHTAKPFKWPWMVQLLIWDDSTIVSCGGSLLTERHVLTAAHCVYGHDYRRMKVTLGEYNLIRDQGYEKHFRISKIQIHPEYNDPSLRNDIAILTLDRSVEFSEAIRRVCLPPNDGQDYSGWNATAFGWRDTHKPIWEYVYEEVEVPVLDQEDCNYIYDNYITNKTICAADIDGGRDTCQVDSGSPLLVQVNERWTVIGVTGWRVGCELQGYPDVYTRVSDFLDWISDGTDEL